MQQLEEGSNLRKKPLESELRALGKSLRRRQLEAFIWLSMLGRSPIVLASRRVDPSQFSL
jgi:hypothetical protein